MDAGVATALIGSATAIIGIVVGGGLSAWQRQAADARESAATLSALCAEVEALTRLVRHRGFVQDLVEQEQQARALIEGGQGSTRLHPVVIPIEQNYFSVFDALAGKIGVISPYFADRIVRFYALAKAAVENMSPNSPWTQQPFSAEDVHGRLVNDLVLIDALLRLGDFIGTFRGKLVPPPGMIDPFDFVQQPPPASSDAMLSSDPTQAIEPPKGVDAG